MTSVSATARISVPAGLYQHYTGTEMPPTPEWPWATPSKPSTAVPSLTTHGSRNTTFSTRQEWCLTSHVPMARRSGSSWRRRKCGEKIVGKWSASFWQVFGKGLARTSQVWASPKSLLELASTLGRVEVRRAKSEGKGDLNNTHVF